MSNQPAGGVIAAAITVWIVCACAGTLIYGIAIDTQGRQAYNHPGAVPANVTLLRSDAYLVGPDAPVTTAQICASGIVSQNPVPQKRGYTFVECNGGQTWNDHREPSPNFGTALKRVVTDTVAQAAYAISLTLLLIIFVAPAIIGGIKETRRSRRRRVAEQQRAALLAEGKQAALGAAYAKNLITLDQFDTAVRGLIADPGEELDPAIRAVLLERDTD